MRSSPDASDRRRCCQWQEGHGSKNSAGDGDSPLLLWRLLVGKDTMADWRLNAFLIRTTSGGAGAEMPKMPQLTGQRPMPVFMSLSGARHPGTSGRVCTEECVKVPGHPPRIPRNCSICVSPFATDYCL